MTTAPPYPTPPPALQGKTILLAISGGIAAYKALELIRLIRKDGGHVRCILTAGGAQFITPLSVSSLSEHPCYTDLFSLKDESEMGHIRLSREADLIVVAPASAHMIAKIAHGLCDDLATATLLAADKQILLAPAMNHMMWTNAATQDNMATLRRRGMLFCGPETGDMACGEHGLGRMGEPAAILAAIRDFFTAARPLAGLSALVTSGPTYEPLDPVRFIGNRSSGKQGHAIAATLAQAGATVTLITGPVALPPPAGVKTIAVETAAQMLSAVQSALPAAIAVCAAAVSDWRAAEAAPHKLKKQSGQPPPAIALAENPDILATIARHPHQRPRLVIGFAAETQDLVAAAQKKRLAKNCDWIIGNDVATDDVFGADDNRVTLITAQGTEEWPKAGKDEVARRLVTAIAAHFTNDSRARAAE